MFRLLRKAVLIVCPSLTYGVSFFSAAKAHPIRFQMLILHDCQCMKNTLPLHPFEVGLSFVSPVPSETEFAAPVPGMSTKTL